MVIVGSLSDNYNDAVHITLVHVLLKMTNHCLTNYQVTALQRKLLTLFAFNCSLYLFMILICLSGLLSRVVINNTALLYLPWIVIDMGDKLKAIAYK